MTYTIKCNDGRTQEASTYFELITTLREMFGREFELGEDEQDGFPDEDGRRPMRRLVWACEADSVGDDGSNAVASVRWYS